MKFSDCRLWILLSLGLGFFEAASPCLVAAPTPREAFLAEQARRSGDPWPRGSGHVLLGIPGLSEDWKGYHEPGGSFSPGFATFGISLWVVDDRGYLLTSSDQLPMAKLTQEWAWPEKSVWPPRPDLPGVATRTPYYSSTWTPIGDGKVQLRLRTGAEYPVWIMVRSAGPAGAPIRSVKLVGEDVYVNDRWILKLTGPGARVDVAAPGKRSGLRADEPAPFWPAEQPLGYARFRLMPGQEYWLTVESVRRPLESPLPLTPGRALLKLDLPDPRFGVCLDAQIAQLLTGLVGDETRPGDPNNYPLNWLRDGAYVIAALARAGQLEVARELCRPFAQDDFFGGFGAEADAPGLALWALEEVAVRANDRAFADSIWPDVVRKAGLIEEMLEAEGPMRKPYTGPVVPAYAGEADLDLVCEAARDGLIVGRMDWHRPLLYVNAVSYRGLVAASRLAARRGATEQAGRWAEKANALREAWNRAMSGHESSNDRTAICGLHPTWVLEDVESYSKLLMSRRAGARDDAGGFVRPPLWTYFLVAEAHQWLLLGRADKAWEDLRWLWNNEASPGLYTWWEGAGEENTFGRWEQVWGWAKPPHVTPHYWTAAEMAMLQLDMLVTVEESDSGPRLLIGPGIPSAWTGDALRVEGRLTRLGRVDWEWRKGRLTVKYDGPEVPIIPGPAFPAGAELRIRK